MIPFMKKFLALLGVASAFIYSGYGAQVQKLPIQSQPLVQQPVVQPNSASQIKTLSKQDSLIAEIGAQYPKKKWLATLLCQGLFNKEVNSGQLNASIKKIVALALEDEKLGYAAALSPALAQTLLSLYDEKTKTFEPNKEPGTAGLNPIAQRIITRILKLKGKKLFPPDCVVKQTAEFVGYLCKTQNSDYSKFKEVLFKGLPTLAQQGKWLKNNQFLETIENPGTEYPASPFLKNLKTISTDEFFKTTIAGLSISIDENSLDKKDTMRTAQFRVVPYNSLLPYLNEDFANALSTGIFEALKSGIYTGNRAWEVMKIFDQVLTTGVYTPGTIENAIEGYVSSLVKDPAFMSKKWRADAWQSFKNKLPDFETANGRRRFAMSALGFIFVAGEIATCMPFLPLSPTIALFEEIVLKSFALNVEALGHKDGKAFFGLINFGPWELAEEWWQFYKFYPSYSYPYTPFLPPENGDFSKGLMAKGPLDWEQELRTHLRPQKDYLVGRRFGVNTQNIEEIEGKARVIEFVQNLFLNIASKINALLSQKNNGLSEDQAQALASHSQNLTMCVDLITVLTHAVAQATLKYNTLFSEAQKPGSTLPPTIIDLVNKVKDASNALGKVDFSAFLNYEQGQLLQKRFMPNIFHEIVKHFKQRLSDLQKTDAYKQECLDYYNGCLGTQGKTPEGKKACLDKYNQDLTKDLFKEVIQKLVLDKEKNEKLYEDITTGQQFDIQSKEKEIIAGAESIANDLNDAVSNPVETQSEQNTSGDNPEPWIGAAEKKLEEDAMEKQRTEEIEAIKTEEQTQTVTASQNLNSNPQTNLATQQPTLSTQPNQVLQQGVKVETK